MTKTLGIAMRHRLASTHFAIVATLVMGHCSTVNAGSSFRVVTAPGYAPEAQAEAQNAGSTFRVVTAPEVAAARSDATQAQAQQVVPHTDEPLPGEPAAREPAARQPAAGEPQTNNEVPREEILLPPKTERQVSVSQPFTQLVISNPQVLDILPINDRIVVLKALNLGNSDVLFYRNEKLIGSLEVNVNNFVSRRGAVVADSEAQLPTVRPMEVHNKALLTSHTDFQCGLGGCVFVGEVTVSEPFAQPRGNVMQSVNSTSNSIISNPTPGAGAVPTAPGAVPTAPVGPVLNVPVAPPRGF
jgi:Pilus formation protein N terminal region